MPKGKRRRPRRRRRKAEAEHAPQRGGSQSVGSRIGSSLGGILGGVAQRGISRIFGRGEYKEALAGELGVDSSAVHEGETPEVNSLVTPVNSQVAVPLMEQDHEGSVTITRREFVRLIDISENASTYNVRVNPGYQGSFPWCHALARNFQKYTIVGMAHEYVPTSGYAVSSTNAALGFVSLAYQYNVAELQTGAEWPITQVQGILNMNGSVSMSPAAVGTCYLECKPDMTNQPTKFVYTGSPQETHYSQANYDWAVLLIRSEGAQNPLPYTCGQLWCTYQIRFFDPRPQDPNLSLGKGDVRKLLEEYTQLSEFQGPMSDKGQILHSSRLDEIKAVLSSVEFVNERTKQMRESLLDRVEHKDQEPDCPELDRRLQQYCPPQHSAHKLPLPYVPPPIRVVEGDSTPPYPPNQPGGQWKVVQ